jgi:putative ABC transport system permease protein
LLIEFKDFSGMNLDNVRVIFVSMIKNYLVIAWRTLLKNKLFSFINIFGLALSMSIGMMVIIRTVDNFSFDSFHPGSERTYRILSQITNPEGDKWKLASTPLPLREYLSSESAIEVSVSLYPGIHANATDGVKEIYVSGMFTQPSFFKVFGFRLMHGDEKTALSDKKGIVITKNTAEKFFGDDNPVGRTLTLDKFGAFEVTGVIAEPPGKSHIQVDVFVPYEALTRIENDKLLPRRSTTWDSFEYSYTFVRLKDGADKAILSNLLSRTSDEISKDAKTGRFDFIAQPLASITPGSNDIYNDIGNRGSWGKLLIEMGVALIILFAACFNYTNLSLARALTRAKEVGIRKVSGAARWQIFGQYIVEAIVISLFALIVAQVILSFILEFKPFNDGYEFVPEISMSAMLIGWFVLFSLFAGLVAGAMPAWILSSFRPIRILKNLGTEKITGNVSLRKVLMVFQFSLSLVILIFLSSFYRQFEHMASADPGFERNNIVSIPCYRNDDVLASEISRIGGVEEVTMMSGNFGKYSSGRVPFALEKGETKPLTADFYYVDQGTVEVMGLDLITGRNFNAVNPAHEREVIINEKSAALLGFKDLKDVVGQQVYIQDSIAVQVIGVVRDFYSEGVANPISPLLLRNKAGLFRVMNVKVNSLSSQQTLLKIESTWKKVHPESLFAYSWLDKDLQAQHDQKATISLLGFLASMTVVIASLGLLGLVVFTVETRRKEISIRKIIGAQVHQLMFLLSRGFASLLIIAAVIAIPAGYLLSMIFLQNFATRVSLGASGFIVSFVILLSAGLLAIIPQTYKAASENPAKNLRSE